MSTLRVAALVVYVIVGCVVTVRYWPEFQKMWEGDNE